MEGCCDDFWSCRPFSKVTDLMDERSAGRSVSQSVSQLVSHLDPISLIAIGVGGPLPQIMSSVVLLESPPVILQHKLNTFDGFLIHSVCGFNPFAGFTIASLTEIAIAKGFTDCSLRKKHELVTVLMRNSETIRCVTDTDGVRTMTRTFKLEDHIFNPFLGSELKMLRRELDIHGVTRSGTKSELAVRLLNVMKSTNHTTFGTLSVCTHVSSGHHCPWANPVKPHEADCVSLGPWPPWPWRPVFTVLKEFEDARASALRCRVTAEETTVVLAESTPDEEVESVGVLSHVAVDPDDAGGADSEAEEATPATGRP